MDSTFFGQSTGLYFYSAVFQGDIALLGFLGVFLVFRLQQISSDIVWKRTKLDAAKERHFVSLSKSILKKDDPNIDLLNAAEFISLSQVKLSEKEHDAFLKERKRIIHLAEFPFFLTIIVAVLATISLLMANWFHKTCICAEAIVIILIALMNFAALFFCAIFVVREVRRSGESLVVDYEEDKMREEFGAKHTEPNASSR